MIRMPKFKIVAQKFARSMFLGARQNPRNGLFLGRDPNTGEDVAFAFVSAPEYAPPLKHGREVRLWQRVVNFFLQYVFKLQDMWAQRSFTDLLAPRPMLAEFDYGRVACGAAATDERMEALEKLPSKQLYDVSYPSSLAYYLRVFGVRQDYHGKGVGKTFMQSVLAQLCKESEIVPPPGLDGPAKLEFFSSPNAVGFYQRNGFTLAASSEPRTLPSGAVLVHHFFYLNL